MDGRTWTAGQAARLSGLTLSMLNYVNRIGVLQPFAPEPHRRAHGRRRRYCFADVVLLRAVAKMSSAGISILRLAEGLSLLQQFRNDLSAAEAQQSRYLVTTGFQAYFADTQGIGSILEACAAPAIVLDMNQIRSEVLQAAADLTE